MPDVVKPFSFQSPALMICDAGACERLGNTVKHYLGDSILLVTDQGLVDTGLVDSFCRRLRGDGLSVVIFSGVQADPTAEVVTESVHEAVARGISGVIGFGGGSSMDVAKLVALLGLEGRALEELFGVDQVSGERLPLMLIPTTAGTGSEATPVAIVTTAEGEKKGIVTALNVPDVAVLDPMLTSDLPARVTAATGIDAMSHAIEAYTSAAKNNNPMSKMLACQALQLLSQSLAQAVADGSDVDVRSAMLLGSYYAGLAFANAPVSGAHALAYPIGTAFHLPHGVAIALLLPSVMAFNSPCCESAYAALAADVNPEFSGVTASERAEHLVSSVAHLIDKIGLPQRLRDVGIEEQNLPELADQAMHQERLLQNNPRPITADDALSIYRAAF